MLWRTGWNKKYDQASLPLCGTRCFRVFACAAEDTLHSTPELSARKRERCVLYLIQNMQKFPASTL